MHGCPTPIRRRRSSAGAADRERQSVASDRHRADRGRPAQIGRQAARSTSTRASPTTPAPARRARPRRGNGCGARILSLRFDPGMMRTGRGRALAVRLCCSPAATGSKQKAAVARRADLGAQSRSPARARSGARQDSDHPAAAGGQPRLARSRRLSEPRDAASVAARSAHRGLEGRAWRRRFALYAGVGAAGCRQGPGLCDGWGGCRSAPSTLQREIGYGRSISSRRRSAAIPLAAVSAFWNDRLYASTGYAQVLALDPADGKVIWRSGVGAPVRSAPTVADGRVFAVTVENELVVLAADDGRRLWTHNGIPETAGLLGGASPAVEGEVVVAAYSSGEIFALTVETGGHCGPTISLRPAASTRSPPSPISAAGRSSIAAASSRPAIADAWWRSICGPATASGSRRSAAPKAPGSPAITSMSCRTTTS